MKNKINNHANNNITISSIRMLSVDAINKANSGHPGMCLGISPTFYSLFKNHINISPKNYEWINRDRFILSAGHGSMLIYSLLHLLSPKDMPMDELKSFRQINSKTPGHPEYGLTKGIDCSAGPLGQGIASGVGMAIAEKHLSDSFNKPNLEIFNHHTYVICGDGCLQEGISQEAISIAGTLKLSKLILIYDSNHIQIDGNTDDCNKEITKKRIISAGWDYILVDNGNDLDEINKAIKKAKKSSKPAFIECKTIIGYGTPKQGTSATHGAPIGLEGREVLANKLNWTRRPFDIPQEAYDDIKKNISNKGNRKYNKWVKNLKKYADLFPKEYKNISKMLNKTININWEEIYSKNEKDYIASREFVANILSNISKQSNMFLNGSADLCASTKVKGDDGDFGKDKLGKNILYGVREFGMTAIGNGIVLHGCLRATTSTFLVFSDYLKSAIRSAALMEIPTWHVFSHDSLFVGEDGPTHQPVEHLTMLRTIPGINIYRPATYNEAVWCFKDGLSRNNSPSVFVSSRQPLNNFKYKNNIENGAYIFKQESLKHSLTILTSGSELELSFELSKKIEKEKNLGVRVVSVPNLNAFLKSSKEFRKKIIGCPVKKVVIEMSDCIFWHQILNNDVDEVFSINKFGLSGPGEKVANYFGFSIDNLYKKIIK